MCECEERERGPRGEWYEVNGEHRLRGADGWSVRENKRKAHLFDPLKAFAQKVYPWLLCRHGEPVAEIGDRKLAAALAKAEHAINGDQQGRAISKRFMRVASRP